VDGTGDAGFVPLCLVPHVDEEGSAVEFGGGIVGVDGGNLRLSEHRRQTTGVRDLRFPPVT
jgi:hypothetical protein